MSGSSDLGDKSPRSHFACGVPRGSELVRPLCSLSALSVGRSAGIRGVKRSAEEVQEGKAPRVAKGALSGASDITVIEPFDLKGSLVYMQGERPRCTRGQAER